jgi:hypothetical protein
MSDFSERPIVVTEGKKTNPTGTTLLADTGPVPRTGDYKTHLFIEAVGWAEVGAADGATFIIEHRNAANDGNIRSAEVNFLAGQNVIIPYIAELADGERVRVVQGGTVPGAGIDVQILLTGRTVHG